MGRYEWKNSIGVIFEYHSCRLIASLSIALHRSPSLSSKLKVFTTFWPLGLIAFGGPQAHVAILRDHLVVKRQWLDEDSFMELFAIGQGLPGPTSTQLVTSVALARAGPLGGLLAFALWQVPGLVVLTICGTLIASFLDPNNPPYVVSYVP